MSGIKDLKDSLNSPIMLHLYRIMIVQNEK